MVIAIGWTEFLLIGITLLLLFGVNRLPQKSSSKSKSLGKVKEKMADAPKDAIN